MKLKLFHAPDTMDWVRILWVVSGLTFFWERISSVVPAEFHKTVTTILVALVATIAMMMKSGVSRADKIEAKIEEHQADGAKKAEEIKDLVVNELKEKAAEKEAETKEDL